MSPPKGAGLRTLRKPKGGKSAKGIGSPRTQGTPGAGLGGPAAPPTGTIRLAVPDIPDVEEVERRFALIVVRLACLPLSPHAITRL
ncbi:hypothetical protein [Delftia acidovorans]